MINMMPSSYQEESILKQYALAIIFVHVLAMVWILLNEAVMGIGNAAFDMVGTTGQAADMINFLILIYRVIPIGMIIGVWVWIFLRAAKREPYYQQF